MYTSKYLPLKNQFFLQVRNFFCLAFCLWYLHFRKKIHKKNPYIYFAKANVLLKSINRSIWDSLFFCFCCMLVLCVCSKEKNNHQTQYWWTETIFNKMLVVFHQFYQSFCIIDGNYFDKKFFDKVFIYFLFCCKKILFHLNCFTFFWFVCFWFWILYFGFAVVDIIHSNITILNVEMNNLPKNWKMYQDFF